MDPRRRRRERAQRFPYGGDTDYAWEAPRSAATRPRRHRRPVRPVTILAAALVVLLSSGCGAGNLIPNPFAADEPTPVPPVPTRPPPTPTAMPATPAPAAVQPTPTFTPFWVKNHRLTEMWSGPTDAPGVISFGTTSQQFCSFQVALPPGGQRLYVFNPHSQNYFWIDADAVGPVGPPEQRPGPPPPGQNCAQAV